MIIVRSFSIWIFLIKENPNIISLSLTYCIRRRRWAFGVLGHNQASPANKNGWGGPIIHDFVEGRVNFLSLSNTELNLRGWVWTTAQAIGCCAPEQSPMWGWLLIFAGRAYMFLHGVRVLRGATFNAIRRVVQTLLHVVLVRLAPTITSLCTKRGFFGWGDRINNGACLRFMPTLLT
jgi:hypothetical protein